MNVIHVRVPGLRALPGQLFDYHRIRAAREFAHFFGCQIVERMRRDKQRQIVELQVFRRQTPVRQKRGRNNC
jgi:hypothetical protein